MRTKFLKIQIVCVAAFIAACSKSNDSSEPAVNPNPPVSTPAVTKVDAPVSTPTPAPTPSLPARFLATPTCGTLSSDVLQPNITHGPEMTQIFGGADVMLSTDGGFQLRVFVNATVRTSPSSVETSDVRLYQGEGNWKYKTTNLLSLRREDGFEIAELDVGSLATGIPPLLFLNSDYFATYGMPAYIAVKTLGVGFCPRQ